MTITTDYVPDSYAGNGVTATFDYNWSIAKETDLYVTKIITATGAITVLALGTDYTVRGEGSQDGGSITLAVVPPTGTEVLIQRVTPRLQETDLKNQGAYYPETVERAFDNLQRQIQEVRVDVAADGDTLLRADLASGTGGGALVSFLQSGTSSVLRTVQSKLRESISVLDKGAKGDGTTNDTAAFTAAITSAVAAGKAVFVPATTASYLLDDLSIPANCVIFGEGVKSKLTPFTVGSPYVLALGASATDVQISNMSIEAPKATYPAKTLIVGGGGTRIYIHDMTLNGGANGISLLTATDCVAERVRVLGFGNIGISMSVAATRCKILSCDANGNGSTGSAIEFRDGTDCLIDNCTVTEAGVFGIFLQNCVASKITDCATRNTTREGININASNNCEIANNNVSFANSGFSTDFGISVWGSGANSTNNRISNNVVRNSYLSGIALAGDQTTVSYNMVNDNTIHNCGREAAAHSAGVVVYGPNAVNNSVVDNTIFDDVNALRYGVFDDPVLGATTGTFVSGNRITNALTAKVSKSATGFESVNGLVLADKTWTPTITTGSGTITAVGAVTAKYYEVEKMVFFSLSITITTNGTGATDLRASLPFGASANNFVLAGKEIAVGGKMLSGAISPSGGVVRILNYDNSYPGGNGTQCVVSGWFERA